MSAQERIMDFEFHLVDDDLELMKLTAAVDSIKPPTNVNRMAVRELHLAWLDRLETAFEIVMLRSLKRAIHPVARHFASLTAQGDPEFISENFVSADDLAQIRTVWATQVAEELLPLLADVYTTGAQGVGLAVAGVSTEVPDVVSVGAQEWLSVAQNRLVRVGDTAWLAARSELLEGFQRGESIDELAKRVRSAVDVSSARARVVARTEVIGASNAGAFAEALAMDVQEKTWLSTDDARTRPTHVRADGQRVAMDEPFMVGGSRLRFPHDPLGPRSETIQCRCTLLFDANPACVCTPGWVKQEAGSLTSAGAPDCACSDDPIPLAIGAFNPIEHRNAGGSFNSAKARKWGTESWDSWRTDISGRSRQSIRAYTSSDSYTGINARARGLELTAAESKKIGVLDRHIANIDAAFDNPLARAPADVLTYRTMTGPVARRLNEMFDEGSLIVKNAERGAVFRDKGFVSTTLDKQVFYSAGMWKDAPVAERVVMHIQLRRGSPAIYPGELSNLPREAEIILPRGTRFEVLDAERVTTKGVLHITVRVVE